MNYSFPLAFLFNNSAITLLLIFVGLTGNPVMAAEIAIIHASTQALFFAFSANARNLILGRDSLLGAHDLLRVRMLLVLPLSVMAFFLVDYVIEINIFLVIFIIARRAFDWILEVNMSEMERSENKAHVSEYIIIQSVMLIVALSWLLFGTEYPFAGIYLWCLSPLLSMLQMRFSTHNKHTSISDLHDLLLPHFGSTAVIGVALYVFRVVITLLVGKELAGDLFTAFSIGGVIGTVFASSIGPSVALRIQKGDGFGLPSAIKVVITMNVALGILLATLSQYDINILEVIGKSKEFTLAVGLSMIGGAIMVAAQMARLKVVQLGKNGNVFGADVLMNIILITVIPYANYLLGSQSLGALYLLSATLAYIFYQTSCGDIENIVGIHALKGIRVLIAFLLLFPIFFMLDGSIFANASFNYESQGLIRALPIPVSFPLCFVGIVLLGRYRFSHTSLAVIFIIFSLMTMSVLLSSPDMSITTQGKFILLMQFILPYFALVLGQAFEGRESRQVMEKTFFIVLLLVVPVQVVITLIHPNPLLAPLIGFFSIYQHLQYVPVIFVSAYLLVLFSLYRYKYYLTPLLFLTVFMGVYAGASYSRLAVVLFVSGVALFTVYSWKNFKTKTLVVLVFMVMVSLPFAYIQIYKDAGNHDDKFTIGFNLDNIYDSNSSNSLNNKAELTSKDRLEYWRVYTGKISESPSALLFGHASRIDRYEYPSAHNYYLDFVYHFGLIAILPLLYLIFITIRSAFRSRKHIFSNPILGLTFVVFFIVLIDSSLKVGFRQPYPGVYMFFVWGILLTRLYILENKKHGYS